MGLYSVSCSLYQPRLRYSWTHSFIHSAYLSPLKIYIHRLGCVIVSPYPLCVQGSQFSCPLCDWRQWYRCGEQKAFTLNEKLFKEHRIAVADCLAILTSHPPRLMQTGSFCICTQRKGWISHLGRSEAWRGYVYSRVRWVKGALPWRPFLKESAFFLHKGKRIFEPPNRCVTCCLITLWSIFRKPCCQGLPL